jgi:hypothetical protein
MNMAMDGDVDVWETSSLAGDRHLLLGPLSSELHEYFNRCRLRLLVVCVTKSVQVISGPNALVGLVGPLNTRVTKLPKLGLYWLLPESFV